MSKRLRLQPSWKPTIRTSDTGRSSHTNTTNVVEHTSNLFGMPQKKQEEIYRKAYDQLCSYLDEHNLRHTPERLCILSSACSLQRFTVDDLRYSLTGILISRATVYKAHWKGIWCSSRTVRTIMSQNIFCADHLPTMWAYQRSERFYHFAYVGRQTIYKFHSWAILTIHLWKM